MHPDIIPVDIDVFNRFGADGHKTFFIPFAGNAYKADVEKRQLIRRFPTH